MNAHELGKKLVDWFNAGEHERIMTELYGDSIKSVEADGSESNGLSELKKKYEWWESNFEVHGTTAKGPFPHGDESVAVVFWMDTTHKESENRSQMDEVAVYKVKDGRIVEERFFYAGGGEA